jgi:uncharacterized DUF497 family protein
MLHNFEWDEDKARLNLVKHKVSFDEAVTVFTDPLSITIPDPDHSEAEQRHINIGASSAGDLLVVAYTEHGRSIRIVTCREATAKERRKYEEAQQ